MPDCPGALGRVKGQEVEQRVLRALQDKLMRKDFFEEFCREFAREMSRLRMEQRASLSGAKRELEQELSDLATVSPLAEEPDEERVGKWVLDAYRRRWNVQDSVD